MWYVSEQKNRKPASRKEAGDLPDLPGYVTISLAAEMLGVSRQAAHGMAQSRRLKAWRVPSAGADRPVVVKLRDVKELQHKRSGGIVFVTETGQES